MSIKTEILGLQKLRSELLNKQDEEVKDIIENYDITIDNLTTQILDLIKPNIDKLDFDFIMEQLSHLGWCPNLLYDDNGHWAVSADGYQNVVSGDVPEDVETHFYIEAEDWKNSPKEALYKFLHDDNSEE
jgi:hypothetical protein